MERRRKTDARVHAASLALWLATASTYFLLAAGTIHFTSDGRNIATFWPADALLVALLICHGSSQRTNILSAGLIANVAANWLTRGTLMAPLLYSVANLIEVIIVVNLLGSRTSEDGILGSSKLLIRFVLVAGLLGPAASGVLGAATAYLLFDQEFVKSFSVWMFSNGLGLVIFTPVFRAMLSGDFTRFVQSRSKTDRLELVALLALTAGIIDFVFLFARQPLLFLVFPPVMLITFRFGRLGTKLAVMLVALIGAMATINGYGPIVSLTLDPDMQSRAFQIFLAGVLLTCLPVAAEVSARSRLVTQLDDRERELTERATTDVLTKTLNRAAFQSLAETYLASSRKVSFVILDVDHFKAINDSWGHQVGDDALIHLVSVLREAARLTDVIGRFGGDEFVLLMPDSEIVHAQAVCERFKARLRQFAFRADDKTDVMLSISCGVAMAQPNETYDDLLRRADTALYSAKAAGRNRVYAA